MDRGAAFACWLLVAGLLLGSCTNRACSSRLLLAADEAREAASSDGGAKARVDGGGVGKQAVPRRSLLGLRVTSPPSPVPNAPRSNAAPGPPQ
ncbi:hypothetical protein BRADI_1g47584v3 [Brachypodium distachyon]|uniref:Uncharacterized protein n=1 Tax=Brachypodium distachyon TaxID=15368 RepID=A0A0Q3NP23_BRADI|nr:hypothetical protein BRADI_1g47584v3 [Brachypodium distachyon]